MNVKEIISALILILLCSSTAMSQISLTKVDFLKRVENNAKEIKLAYEEIKLAHAKHQEVFSLALPKVNVLGGYQRNIKKERIFLEVPDFNTFIIDPETGEASVKNSFQGYEANLNNDFNASVGISQTLFSPSTIHAIQAGKLYKNITRYKYENSKQEMLAEAEKLYVSAQFLKAIFNCLKKEESEAYANYTQQLKNNQLGLISELELTEAERLLSEVAMNVSEANASYKTALIQIKYLTGIQEDIIQIEEVNDNEPGLSGLIINREDLLRNRADYLAIQETELLMKKQIQFEKSSFLPAIEANWQYSYFAQSNSFNPQENKNTPMILGIGLSWNLFTGGNRSAKIQQATIKKEKMLLEKEILERSILMENEKIISDLEAQSHAITHRKKIRDMTNKALTIKRKNLELGLANLRTYREAASEKRNAEVSLLKAQLAYKLLMITYRQNTGK